MIAVRAKSGLWCDTSSKVSGTVAAALVASSFVGIARYVPLPGVSSVHDIDTLELLGLTTAGLQVLLVQHVRFAPWHPSQCDPIGDAVHALEHARAAGYPQGAHLFADLEGADGGALSAYQYIDRWSMAVIEAGYRAGLYVGYDSRLSPQQLYDLEYVDSYWSDAGPREVAVRGFALKQGVAFALAGVQFDHDDMTPDAKDETPFACAA